jgi:hypothetical protein
MERELTRALSALKEDMQKFEETMAPKPRNASTQTDYDNPIFSLPEIPLGYAIPRVFVRAVAEAVEQGVVTYCPSLTTSAQRENAMIRLLHEIAEYATAPRHLHFESFETKPTWYDYLRITVFDHVTATVIATADLIPPISKAVLQNVNKPLYDSAVVSDVSVPHLPQVEISLLTFNPDDKNRVVAQSVTVPLDLFVKASTILTVLEDGSEREISYRALLVRNDPLESPN